LREELLAKKAAEDRNWADAGTLNPHLPKRTITSKQVINWLADWTAEGEGKMSSSRPASRRWSADEEKKLEVLLEAGKEAGEIAVALQRSRQAIYARLQRL